MTGTADQGFGAPPFGEIARAMVAAQEQGLELAQAWSDSLRELVGNQAEGGRAALESFATTTRAQLELARTLLTPLGAQPEAFGGLVQLERRLPAPAGGRSGRPAQAPGPRPVTLRRPGPAAAGPGSGCRPGPR